jgi:hypothetical protein
MLKFDNFEFVWELFFLLCYYEDGYVGWVDVFWVGIFVERLLDADGIII